MLPPCLANKRHPRRRAWLWPRPRGRQPPHAAYRPNRFGCGRWRGRSGLACGRRLGSTSIMPAPRSVSTNRSAARLPIAEPPVSRLFVSECRVAPKTAVHLLKWVRASAQSGRILYDAVCCGSYCEPAVWDAPDVQGPKCYRRRSASQSATPMRQGRPIRNTARVRPQPVIPRGSSQADPKASDRLDPGEGYPGNSIANPAWTAAALGSTVVK